MLTSLQHAHHIVVWEQCDWLLHARLHDPEDSLGLQVALLPAVLPPLTAVQTHTVISLLAGTSSIDAKQLRVASDGSFLKLVLLLWVSAWPR